VEELVRARVSENAALLGKTIRRLRARDDVALATFFDGIQDNALVGLMLKRMMHATNG
jgi:hypothetical protein